MKMNNNGFSVTYHQFGVLISVPIRTQELSMLCKFYKKHYGYDFLDGLIGQKYNCFCLTCEHDAEQWKKELGII